jgi:hypothetical protein
MKPGPRQKCDSGSRKCCGSTGSISARVFFVSIFTWFMISEEGRKKSNSSKGMLIIVHQFNQRQPCTNHYHKYYANFAITRIFCVSVIKVKNEWVFGRNR